MMQTTPALPRRSRLAALLEHFSAVEDPRDVRRILHPLPEILLLVVCGTIADCDDDEDIVGWGEAHLDFHGADEAMLLQQVAVQLGGVLGSAIGVEHATRQRPAQRDRTTQGLDREARVDPATDRVADAC